MKLSNPKSTIIKQHFVSQVTYYICMTVCLYMYIYVINVKQGVQHLIQYMKYQSKTSFDQSELSATDNFSRRKPDPPTHTHWHCFFKITINKTKQKILRDK